VNDEELNGRDAPREVTSTEEHLVGLVRLDYDATLRALSGFVTAAAAVRAVGIATWGVLIGLAIRDDNQPLCLLAAGATLMFTFIDAYHSALYRRALSRAIWIESLLNDYAETLGIYADDIDSVDDVRARLEMHPFGVNRTMRRVAFTDLFDAQPWPVFMVLYPVLVVVSLSVFASYAV
jgi:hypothetical protein